MKTTERFEKAVTKLYNAFNEGSLNALDCCHCAVGNICDNTWDWATNYSIGDINRVDATDKNVIKTGYSKIELINIEYMFLYGSKPDDFHKFRNNISNMKVETGEYTKEEQRELQFKGLCAVVEYLCELDNIPNVMDYQALFSKEKQLEEVF